ncbi:MAG: hypothetical protein CMO81_01135 [Waddliaceae bacterium]|nr:hypothetical protein [Waddliaceae bacterium]
MMNKLSSYSSFLICYLPILVVQVISGIVTRQSIDPWYYSLEKASWNPPPWLFGPVWTLLYVMMTISLYRIYKHEHNFQLKKPLYALFFTQLFLNFLWSILFFGLQETLWALLDLSLLIIVLSITIRNFYTFDKFASYLLIPYLLWISYAFTLNIAIYYLN